VLAWSISPSALRAGVGRAGLSHGGQASRGWRGFHTAPLDTAGPGAQQHRPAATAVSAENPTSSAASFGANSSEKGC